MSIPDNPNKILILQLGGIGDLVLSLPALKAIRKRFKGAEISLLVITRSAGLIRGNHDIDNLFSLDIHYANLSRLFFRKGLWVNLWKTIKELRRNKFDLAVNLENISSLGGAFKMAVFLWLIAARYTVGRNTDGKGFFFNLKIEENGKDNKPELCANLEVARALGAEAQDTGIELPVLEEDNVFAANFLAGCGISGQDLVIGFNPGGFRPSRRWFGPRWAQLARQLIEKYRCKIIITGQESERDILDEIITLTDKKEVIAVTSFNLKQLIALIKRFNLFITNDSGPMHLAAAIRVPLIALFGPGDIGKFSPVYVYEKALVISKDVDCNRPCYRFACQNRNCMEAIQVEDVLGAVRKVLG